MSRGTTHRTVRIDDALWDAAKTKAAEEGRNVSDVIRELLKTWTEETDTHATKLLISPKS